RNAFLPRLGDDAGLEPEHGAAGGTRALRAVYRGGVVVRRIAAAVCAGAGGGLAWQARRDVLGRDHGGAAVAGDRVGSCDPGSSRSLFKTQWPVPADPVVWAGSGVLRRPERPRPGAGERVVEAARRGREIGLRAARIRVLKWAKVELRGVYRYCT